MELASRLKPSTLPLLIHATTTNPSLQLPRSRSINPILLCSFSCTSHNHRRSTKTETMTTEVRCLLLFHVTFHHVVSTPLFQHIAFLIYRAFSPFFTSARSAKNLLLTLESFCSVKGTANPISPPRGSIRIPHNLHICAAIKDSHGMC
jgi:hypothetical protein